MAMRRPSQPLMVGGMTGPGLGPPDPQAKAALERTEPPSLYWWLAGTRIDAPVVSASGT